jgi:2-phospho-L-lactate guanylyltransferase
MLEPERVDARADHSLERVYAVVVARAGAGAKSRLAPVLSPEQRHALVLAMLTDVLEVCHGTPEIDGVLAVVDPSVLLMAPTLRVDDPGEDMNAAVARGVRAACEWGAGTVVVLPGDIPCLTSGDVRALLAVAHNAARAVVIGASRGGDGTNALLLRPPDAIEPAFGPPSVDRHRRLAETAGCHTTVLSGLALALDIDTPADLATLQAQAALPLHTAAYLAQLAARSPR